jgi:hypothetical protein
MNPTVIVSLFQIDEKKRRKTWDRQAMMNAVKVSGEKKRVF